MQQTKHARRLYVGGIPPNTTEDQLGDFMTDLIYRSVPSAAEDGVPAIISVYINHEKCFSFVELKSIELTTTCISFDGVKYPHIGGGSTLRVRRPNDFKPELVAPSVLNKTLPVNLSVLGLVSTTVGDGPGKLFVGGLPYHLTDENVQELLAVFGPLKSFHMVRDAGSVNSKGYGFCEYYSVEISEAAIQGLNGMAIGDKTLTVKFAAPVGGQAGGSAPSMSMFPSMNTGLAGLPQLPGLGGLPGIGMGGLAGITSSISGVPLGAGGMISHSLAPPMMPAVPSIATMKPTRVSTIFYNISVIGLSFYFLISSLFK